MTLKVVEFKKVTEEEPRFPDADALAELQESGLEGVVVITLKKNGHISHYIDGLSDFETYGLLDVVKHTMITNGNMFDADNS